MNYVYPTKDKIMEFFQTHTGFFSVIQITESLIAPHHNNIQDTEWEHVRTMLHQLKTAYLLVEHEGGDIYHEKFSSTPERIQQYLDDALITNEQKHTSGNIEKFNKFVTIKPGFWGVSIDFNEIFLSVTQHVGKRMRIAITIGGLTFVAMILAWQLAPHKTLILYGTATRVSGVSIQSACDRQYGAGSTARVIENNVMGWRCVVGDKDNYVARSIDIRNECVFENPTFTDVFDDYTDFNDPLSWGCYTKHHWFFATRTWFYLWGSVAGILFVFGYYVVRHRKCT